MKKVIIWLAKVFKVDLVRVEVKEFPRLVAMAPVISDDIIILGDVEITGSLLVRGSLHAEGGISCKGGEIISKFEGYVK